MKLRIAPCIDIEGNPGWHIQRKALLWWIDATNWVWRTRDDAVKVAEHIMKLPSKEMKP